MTVAGVDAGNYNLNHFYQSANSNCKINTLAAV